MIMFPDEPESVEDGAKWPLSNITLESEISM